MLRARRIHLGTGPARPRRSRVARPARRRRRDLYRELAARLWATTRRARTACRHRRRRAAALAVPLAGVRAVREGPAGRDAGGAGAAARQGHPDPARLCRRRASRSRRPARPPATTARRIEALAPDRRRVAPGGGGALLAAVAHIAAARLRRRVADARGAPGPRALGAGAERPGRGPAPGGGAAAGRGQRDVVLQPGAHAGSARPGLPVQPRLRLLARRRSAGGRATGCAKPCASARPTPRPTRCWRRCCTPAGRPRRPRANSRSRSGCRRRSRASS